MSLKAKMLIIGIIGSVAIILISLLGTLIYYDKIEKDQILKSVKSARHNFDVALDSKKDVWQTNALQIATSNDVKIALYFQDRDRANRILQTIGETFKKNTGFRNVQIHLIDKNLTSFYKSWAPDRFGEKLAHSAGYRIIRETKKNIAAMEVSEKGLRLKGLFPVYFKEEFVGIANFEGGLNSIKRSMEPYNVEFLYFMDESSTDIAKGMAGKPVISNFILNQNDFNKDFFDYVKNNGIIGKINSEGFYIDKNYLVITNRFKDFEEKDVGLYVLGMKTDVVMETVGSIKNIFFSLFSFITLVFLTLIIGLIVFMNVKAIKPIFGISDHMHESAEQVLEAANRLSSICSSVAQGTGYQSQSINQTSSSIEEISAMTKNNTENSGFANQLMGETNSVIVKANESMTKLTTSMNEISKASEETSKIIKTIDEIAFQTNLLALNAAVEAARAGEAGAGFAVVADEVRNLAMRAAQAAKDTEMMIQGTIKKVYDGATLVNETSKAFSNVAESSGKIGEIVSDIAVASKEQSTGIEQVNRAINEMDTFIKENSANAESSASSAEEMNAQAKQLQKYVRELASLLTGKTGHMEISARKYKAAEKGLRHSIPDMRSSYNTEIKPDQIIKIGKKRY